MSEYLIPIPDPRLQRLIHSQLDLLQITYQILTLAVKFLIADLRLDWGVQLLPLQQIPVETFEVLHALYLAEIFNPPYFWVFLQQTRD